MAKSMGKEVKITIGVLSVLLGAFGSLLYYRMQDDKETPPGPHVAEQLAAAAAKEKSTEEPTELAPANEDAESPSETDWGLSDDRWSVPPAPQPNTMDDEPNSEPTPAYAPSPDAISSRRRQDEPDLVKPDEDPWPSDNQPAEPYDDNENAGSSAAQDPFDRHDDPVASDSEAYGEPNGFAQPDSPAMPADSGQPTQVDDYAAEPYGEMSTGQRLSAGALEPTEEFEPPPNPSDYTAQEYQPPQNDIAPTAGYETEPYGGGESTPTPAAPTSDYRQQQYGQPSAPTQFDDQFGEPGPLPSDEGLENFARADDRYVVATADNYWVISKKLYGTGGYFKALYEHNKDDYPRADQLRAGDEISAPSIAVLERTYPHLCPRPFRSSAAQREQTTPASATSRPSGRRNYVVEEGDTLFDIAKQELGRASRWVEIYDMNRAALGDNVDLLRPGTELALPAAEGVEPISRRPSRTLQR